MNQMYCRYVIIYSVSCYKLQLKPRLSLSQPELCLKAQASILVGLSRSKPARSCSLQAKLGRNITTQRGLLMIVFDLTDRTAITVYHGSDVGSTGSNELLCFRTSVIPNTNTSVMVATILWHLPIGTDHPQWSKNLVHRLARYYDSLLQSLNCQHPEKYPIACLQWKWSLHPNAENAGQMKRDLPL